MSRTRKNKKYTGSHFASNFHAGIKSKSPMFSSDNPMKQMVMNEQQEVSNRVQEGIGSLKEKAFSTVDQFKSGFETLEYSKMKHPPAPNDVVPEKFGDRRAELEAYQNRHKSELEADAEAKKKEEELEAEKERLMEEYTKDGYTDDYSDDMDKKEARLEHKENKGELKEQFKAEKAGLKARKKSGELSGKEYRAEKKKAKQKRKAGKKSSKCKKKAAQGKSHKRWYRKNCT